MSDKPSTKPTVIDDAYMEQFSDDELAYMAWNKSEFALGVFADPEESKCEDCVSDARFELMTSVLATKALVRRYTGIDPQAIRDRAFNRILRADCFPQWETMQ